MKILNNRYRIIKELSAQFKNDRCFIVENLDSDTGERLELRIVYASILDDECMKFIKKKFILIKNLQKTLHIKNYDFTRLSTIDDKRVEEDIYLYTTSYIGEKEFILDFLPTAKPEEVVKLFILILKELNYLITYGIIYNSFNLNNIYVIRENNEISIRVKDFITEKIQYSQQLGLLSNSQIHTFNYSADILKSIILSLLLKKNIIKNYENHFQDLIKIEESASKDEKKIYKCFFQIYHEINKYKLKQKTYSFYEMVSHINQSLNLNYNIATPINKLKDYRIQFGHEKEKKEILSVFKRIKKDKVENKNFIINAELGMGKTMFLSELYFLLLLEKLDVYYIPSLGETDDLKFILYLMKNLFLKNPLIQKNHEKEIKSIYYALKAEIEIDENIKLINSLKYKLINLISNLIIEGTPSRYIVFIIDDIHFINEFITKSLLYITIENLDKKNIILIQSANEILINKNENAQKLIKTLSAKSSIKKLYLQNLSEDETEELIRSTLNIKIVPDILLKKLYKLTSGQPLFINSSLNELILSKELKKDELTELCKLSENLSNASKPIPISQNIEQVIKNQIKNLDKEELDFLNNLSIFKTSFKVEHSYKVFNIKPAIVRKYLSKFLEQNIIKKISKSSVEEYSIVNKILQNTLYNELDHSYKIEIHKKIICIIKNLKSINIYELIWHSEKANIIEEAIDYCIKNKNQIKKHYADTAYIAIYEEIYSLILNKDSDKKLEILLILIEAYLENDEMNKSRKKIEIAKNIIKKSISNKKAIAQFYIIKAIQEIKFPITNDNIAESVTLAEKFTAETNDTYTKLWLEKLRVLFLQHIKKYDEAIEKAKKIIVKCGNSKEFEIIKTKVLLDLGNNMFHSEQYKEAEKVYIETVKFAKKTGNTNVEDSALNNLAIIQERLYKNFYTTISYYTKILENNISSGNTTVEILVLLNLSITYSYLYDYENAYNFCSKAIKKITQSLNEYKIFFTYVFMHDILLSLCMYDKTYEIQKQIIEMLKNKNILKQSLQIAGFEQTESTFHYIMGDFSFKPEYLYQNVDGNNEIKNIMTILSSISFELNKIAEGKSNSTKRIENELIKLTSNSLFLDNIYLLFYELILRIRKIIIFRYDINFKKIIKLILSISVNRTSPLIKAPLLFLEGYVDEENCEKKLLEAASLIEKKYMLDLSIDINIKLGLIYLNKNNINMAMINFVEAQKLITIFMKKIPLRYRVSYFNIHNYGLPSVIIEDYINKKINPSAYKKHLKELSYEQIKVLLAKNTVEKLKNNPNFIINIIAQVKSKTPFKNKSINDIIEKFSDDFLKNIKNLLNFTAVNLLANSADVFIVTTDNKIKSLFNFGQNKTIKKIAVLIDSSAYTEANLETKEDASAHLVIPINYYSDNKMTNTTTGYLVFVSNKAINNFGNFGIGFCLNIENIFAFLIESYKTQQEAAIDKLTSALTRKYTETLLKEITKTSKVNNKSFAVVMYDLDKFKKINDKFGHQMGDMVLKTTAKTVLGILKKGQILGRVGGEEFLIIIPEAQEEKVLTIAEKIRKHIEALHFDDPAVTITVSMGIALFPQHGTAEKELLSKADQALYTAKESGRNKIVLWKNDLEPAQKKADRLAGIFTGNVITDTKNILSFIDTVSLIRHSIPKTKRLQICLEKIIDTVGVDSGIFIRPAINKKSKNKFKLIPDKKPEFIINNEFISKVMDEKQELCTIDWKNISGKNEVSGMPNWNSALLVPVLFKGELKAIIYLVVEIRKRQFGAEDLNLTNLFANLIAPYF